MIALIIPGVPIAKKRPRFVRRGKFVHAYDPQETEEGKFLLLVREQFKGSPLVGPLRLSCGFFMPIPKSTSKRDRREMLEEKVLHDKKPDLSNLIKFVEDCGNGIIWQDDKQIVAYGSMIKYYSEEPHTYIQIEEIKRRI